MFNLMGKKIITILRILFCSNDPMITVSFLVDDEKRGGCFSLIVFLLSVSLPPGTVVLSAVYDCGISRSSTLSFSVVRHMHLFCCEFLIHLVQEAL